MSLISEALKKAHMEALRQERATGHLNRVPGALDMPRRQGRSVLTMVVLSNLVLLTAVVIGAWLYFRAPREAGPQIVRSAPAAVVSQPVRPQPPAAPPIPAAEPRVAAAVVEIPAPAAAPAPKPARAVEPPPATKTPAVETAVAAAPSDPEPQTERPLPRLGSAKRAREEVSVGEIGERTYEPPPRPMRGLRGIENGRTYARSVKTSDGYELTLYGLSIAGDRGVALLNGRVLKEGDRVGDFTVGTIEKGRVEIRSGEQHFFMTMR